MSSGFCKKSEKNIFIVCFEIFCAEMVFILYCLLRGNMVKRDILFKFIVVCVSFKKPNWRSALSLCFNRYLCGYLLTF
jgi:hypothetical protein